MSDSARDRTTALLKQRMRWLFRQVPKGLAGDEEAVHQMRVAGRRLRVALPLLASKPEGRRVQRALKVLRDLTRAAGRSRDLDVIVGLLEAHLASQGQGKAEWALLRRRLRATRGRSRVRMAEALLDLEIARHRRDLRKTLARGAEPLFTALLRLRRMRDAEGDALLGAIAALGDRFDPAGLHDLRKRTRRLRYAAEIHDDVREQTSTAAQRFRDLQDELGRIHDTHVLCSWLATQAAASAARGQAGLAGEAGVLAAHFLEVSRGHHAALLERNPASLVEQALEAMGRTRTAA